MNLTNALELADNLVTQPECQCFAHSASECCCEAMWPESLTGLASSTIKELINVIHDNNKQIDTLKQELEDTLRASREGWRHAAELDTERKRLSTPIHQFDLYNIVTKYFTDSWLIEKCKQIVREVEETKGIK